MSKLNAIQKRVLDISYKHKMGHLSSTLSAAPIIDEIYRTKGATEPFILSSGHAALAWYCVLDKYGYGNAEHLLEKHGVHPHRCVEDGLTVSTGSLGMGLTVATGYALADRNRRVHCLISDGEANEGSIWEALRFIHEQQLTNLHVYVNINGMIAYDMNDSDYMTQRLKAFLPGDNLHLCYSKPYQWPFAKDVLTHYYVLKPEDYELLCDDYLANY